MRSKVTAYVWAIALAGAALVLRWLLDPVLGDSLALVTLFGAVAGAVWLGGYRPALVAAVAGYVACNYFFIPPRGAFAFNVGVAVGLLAYLFTCAIILVFGEVARAGRIRINRERELLLVTLRSIGDAVITTDLEGRITYLNKVAETLTGWTQNDALGRPLDDVFRIVNEATRERAESPAVKALREGVVVGLANHTTLIRRDGVECPIDDSAAPIKDEQGRVSGCVMIFRDVTAQRRAEHDKTSQLLTARLLSSIVESSDDAIIGKSLDGVIQTWNASAEGLFGYSAAEAVGRHISLVIPPDRIAEEDLIISALKDGQRIAHFETERVRRDGQRILVSLTISPIKDAHGQVVGASKIVRDVTVRKRLEDDLRRLAANLAEADRRKDEFLATLAHELRNPLAPLLNMLEVLKRSEGDAGTVQRARATIERQLGQLIRLVDDLLDLNRITHNRLELRRSDVELASVIHHAVEASRPIADAAGHEIRVSLPAEPIHLHADAARLAQVFGNLLNNSCKYTRRGGTISIAAERRGADAVVSVRDNGIGIPADKLDSVFEMFTQVDTSVERSQGGLGIGLTLVKRLIRLHGGSIEAKSAGDGRGSEFVVTLPAGVPATAEVAAAPAHASDLTPTRRILVVDDNRDSAESLAMLLAITGNETHMAHDGVAAYEAVVAHRPEVVLLDIGLPKLSGHDVCRRIREQPWGADIVLIALTGWGQEEDHRKSREAGFDGHLVKPVDYAELVALLTSLLPAR